MAEEQAPGHCRSHALNHAISLWAYIRCLFGEVTAAQLAQQQLKEAKRQELVHASAAKYHEAMTVYYRQSVVRLTNYQG